MVSCFQFTRYVSSYTLYLIIEYTAITYEDDCEAHPIVNITLIGCAYSSFGASMESNYILGK